MLTKMHPIAKPHECTFVIAIHYRKLRGQHSLYHLARLHSLLMKKNIVWTAKADDTSKLKGRLNLKKNKKKWKYFTKIKQLNQTVLNGAFLPRLQCTSISNAATLELLHQLWWVRYWELSQCVTLIPCSCSYSNVYFSLPVRNLSGCLLSISVLLANDWNPIANQYISEKRLMHLSNCWNHDREHLQHVYQQLGTSPRQEWAFLQSMSTAVVNSWTESVNFRNLLFWTWTKKINKIFF